MGSEEETWNAAPDSESRHCSNPIPPPHLPAAVASPRHERSSLEVEEDGIEAAIDKLEQLVPLQAHKPRSSGNRLACAIREDIGCLCSSSSFATGYRRGALGVVGPRLDDVAAMRSILGWNFWELLDVAVFLLPIVFGKVLKSPFWISTFWASWRCS